jgi:hypothetical protein
MQCYQRADTTKLPDFCRLVAAACRQAIPKKSNALHSVAVLEARHTRRGNALCIQRPQFYASGICCSREIAG